MKKSTCNSKTYISLKLSKGEKYQEPLEYNANKYFRRNLFKGNKKNNHFLSTCFPN